MSWGRGSTALGPFGGEWETPGIEAAWYKTTAAVKQQTCFYSGGC